MHPHLPSRHSPLAPLIIRYLLLGLLLIAAVAHAQPVDEPWTTPLNLSLSGSAAEPQAFSDDQGVLHLIWQDTVENYFVHVHSQDAADDTDEDSTEDTAEGAAESTASAPPAAALEGESWGVPQGVELPFGTRRYFPDLSDNEPTPLFKPQLAADAEGAIHAIWIDDSNNTDDEDISGNLYHSRVLAAEFDTYSNWSKRLRIATNALKPKLAIGPEGLLHLVYIQTADLAAAGEAEALPAGLYYRQSDDSGQTWSTPVALHHSAYFRLLTEETGNVQLAVEGQTVYVAWDDWPYGRVFIIRSPDNGLTWETAYEIDAREEEDGPTVKGPSGIQIATAGDTLHATWQAGHDGLDCAQFHRWSADGGQTWEPRQRILDTVSGCPTQIQFVQSNETYFLLATTPSTRFLTAWQQTHWGPPEEQPALNNFTHPETYQPIIYACGQVALSQGDELWVASCGQGVSQDIWLQQRSLAALARPRVTPLWEPAAVVAEADVPIVSPVLIADEADRLHAFWTQPLSEAEAPFGPRTTAIQYSQWDRGRWSRPASILNSQQGKSDQPAVAVDAQGLLLAVWSGGNRGEIYFSRAPIASAALPSEWSEPQLLSAADTAASTPAIGVDAAGVIYVVYVIPADEGRGVYLVSSADGGDSWSAPSVVFNGAAAAWEIVAEPRLVATEQGQLHLLWLHRPLPSSVGSDALYYARSTDGGSSWSAAQVVTSGSQSDMPVLWHEIISSGRGIVHRIWQEWNFGRLTIWHQYSPDNGQTWDEASQVTALDNIRIPATLTADGAGQLHLLIVEQEISTGGASELSLRHWLWSGESWTEAERLIPDRGNTNEVHALEAAILNDRLAVVYSSPVEGVGVSGVVVDTDVVLQRLFFSERQITLPDGVSTPAPRPAATPSATAAPSPTPTLEPTPTVVFPTETEPEINQLIPGLSPRITGIVTGLAAAILLIVLLFTVVALYRFRLARTRH